MEFEIGRPLTGDDSVVVIGRDERRTVSLDDHACVSFTCFLSGLAFDHGRAISLDRRTLHAWCIAWHHDRRLDASRLRGQRQCLGMVSARVCDHTT